MRKSVDGVLGWIIISFLSIIRNKAEALWEKLYYNETEQVNYINTLIDLYNTKDRLQKEKFNINF